MTTAPLLGTILYMDTDDLISAPDAYAEYLAAGGTMPRQGFYRKLRHGYRGANGIKRHVPTHHLGRALFVEKKAWRRYHKREMLGINPRGGRPKENG